MDVKKEFRNNLLKRNELEIFNEYNTNPGFEKVKSDISKEMKTDIENISIKRITNEFGSNEFFIELFIYDSVEDMKKIEGRNRKKKVKNK